MASVLETLAAEVTGEEHAVEQHVVDYNYIRLKAKIPSLLDSYQSNNFIRFVRDTFFRIAVDDISTVKIALQKLHEERVINSSELTVLRRYFESVSQFQVVYIIDEFLLGNYHPLSSPNYVLLSVPADSFVIRGTMPRRAQQQQQQQQPVQVAPQVQPFPFDAHTTPEV